MVLMTLEQGRVSGCTKHPEEQVTGFCASCLRERLAGFDPATRRINRNVPTSSTSAIKALFKVETKNRALVGSSSSSRSFAGTLPELRRSKSFSAARGNAESSSGAFEPQRKSCDVRVRNTLWSLFHQENGNGGDREVWGEIEVERNQGFSVGTVIETHEEEEEEEEIRVSEENVAALDAAEKESEVVEEEEVVEVEEEEVVEEEVVEQEEEEEEQEEEETEAKTMKDHIDLDAQISVPVPAGKKPATEKGRDLKEQAGSFWLASVFTKKLQKWRRKQRMKKRGLKEEKKQKQVFRETQSEIIDDGRRSCDTDPRFSLDAGRNSWAWEDPRCSWDEPRASWDGYLIGKVVTRPPFSGEDVSVRRSDNQILVEPINRFNNEDVTTPGGSVQTRDYYSDSSSSQRRRRHLERSGSIQKAEIENGGKSVCNDLKNNTKISPTNLDDIPSKRFMVTEPNSVYLNSNSNSLRDEFSESFETGYRDQKNPTKSRRWSKAWNRTIAGSIWGLIHKRNSKEDERYCRGNVVNRSFSESWPELRREFNGDGRGVLNRKNFRCNSSTSSRNSYPRSSFGNLRQWSSRETNGNSQKTGAGWHRKKKDELVLERNRSARYSPSNVDNGLLRFYLTPLRSSRRVGNGGNNRLKHSHSFARSVFHLY